MIPARLALTLATLALAAPAFAEGDPVKGEKEFGKCKSCHTVEAADGTVIAKGGKTGPNLYGVIGRAAGSTDFKYGASLKAAGEKGLVWDAASFVDYTVDPNAFLKTYLADDKAKSNMTFKMKKGGEDIAAWLVSVAPAN
ncbi:cytochrome C [Gemmobacter sp.]|uniref:c-type cytochrome n=1 Tax=Gemmobacter sp. TaxID=1898957 RepID=UPI002AFE816B|nr:cytochrome C [Gemmobacter sp.]